MTTLSPRLRHAITFQEQQSTRDEDGRETIAWAAVTVPGVGQLVDVPAEVLTGAGREFIQSGQQQADVAARITCRWFPGGIRSDWRVLWDGIVLNIQGLPETDATSRREYRFKCSAGVNEGQ